ncbi:MULTISPECIES: CbiX/SirB N-terminal domain-containing protein [unclassified Undibacterium]|uniref:sirohydrochlorin chelatase n=1 Tax=unclassified Undibacterium TaxID=2630295 RepID=UPI002AC9D7D8|nr:MULTISPECIES: CbiX/SirB N-terminal domain-containing protein [unclassified Undibacterium]MEB0137710.1 CbiX/SirB N-terminal domain-containing protein [Undibacterium sp. CCC2.1]MEB0172848.1 CbiX/SirB N-terminal domain-containing protein [Undibacterium sp. CCC1.1]MEB0176678.1 CbiX/SirB N-terminal domain-containing protein [Undibacterium sp. CCC3.4]MEB0215996.1 CbiX/SirB N-terminal domain-containing protein [Undibacterium sp. 5I2]WPX42285.1 CbiX/SirB N-terminal domain-containing protein [Undiba
MTTPITPITATTASILFAHGAREPRWLAPFQRLQKMTQESLPEQRVELAFLEFMQPNLPDLVASLVASGCQRITVTPVFLGQGGHVLRDLPLLAEQLRASYPQLHLHIAMAVGEDEAVLSAIRDYCIKQS